MKNIEEYSKVLELSKEDVAPLNTEELNGLNGGKRKSETPCPFTAVEDCISMVVHCSE
ncbi:class I lanthipeptide [Williamwhitmania taraxaci]|uniref:Uncharacterized protein n=1 Tax=Williamwhitmania taraxaci TaxID=1640674 RepID=A0A1G6TF41_9BACT|nr:class I lanthipeptide [Williamwhitmania taraxaci]SDD27683.1 hypothetical protein SAMN05216323_11216 [Williamwhitmania taraxaci]